MGIFTGAPARPHLGKTRFRICKIRLRTPAQSHIRQTTCRMRLKAMPHFMRGAVSIPDHARLLRELRLLERRTSSSGKVQSTRQERFGRLRQRVVRLHCNHLEGAARSDRRADGCSRLIKPAREFPSRAPRGLGVGPDAPTVPRASADERPGPADNLPVATTVSLCR
jgi:hypothetical protein